MWILHHPANIYTSSPQSDYKYTCFFHPSIRILFHLPTYEVFRYRSILVWIPIHLYMRILNDAGSMFPDQCVPDRKFLDVAPLVLFVPWVNQLWPMCPVPGPHEGTGHNPVASDASLHPGHRSLHSLCLFNRLVPLRQVQARPTHYNSVKKRFSIFPSPAGMSLTKLSLGGNYKRRNHKPTWHPPSGQCNIVLNYAAPVKVLASFSPF